MSVSSEIWHKFGPGQGLKTFNKELKLSKTFEYLYSILLKLI